MKEHELGFVFPDFVELRSGLLAPVSVVAEPPAPRLPTDLEIDTFKQVVVAHRDPPDPIDAISSWIDESQLDLPSTSFRDLTARIATLPFAIALPAVSWVLRRLHPIQAHADRQLDLARSVYGELPMVPERMSDVVARDPSHMPFAEPLLIPLLRLLIDEAGESSPRVDRDLEIQVERCLLGLPAALDDWSLQGHDARDMPAWLGFFMRKSNYVKGKATLNELVRPHELLRLMSGELDPRAEAERCDAEAALERRYGLSAAEQMRLGLGLAATLRLWDDTDEATSLMRLAPGELERVLSAIAIPTHKHHAARLLVSGDREHFRAEFARLDPEREFLMGMYVPFQQRPFLQLDDGSLVLLAPRFLHEWLTDGFHYRTLDAIAGTPPDHARSGRYLRFAGHVFERYCVELARASHAAAFGEVAIVSGDVAYRTRRGESRTVDLIVAQGSDLVLFEIEHHRPGAPVSIRGSSESAIDDVRAHLVGKVRKLIAFIEELRAGADAHIPGIDMRRIRRIWPVVVSIDAPPQQPPLWDFLDSELGSSLRRAGAEHLTILDAEDFEMLHGAVEGGTSLAELLERKCAPRYARMELALWFKHDPLAPRGERRPRQIEMAYERLMGGALAHLKAEQAS